MTTAWEKKRYGHIPKQVACLGKTKWGAEETAQRAITRLRRDFPDAFESTVRPYRCNYCRRWHIGHEL